MNTPEQVNEFVQELFSEFSLDYEDFFGYSRSEEDEFHVIPFIKDGEIQPLVLKKVGEILGVNPERILEMDESIFDEKYEKFPYLSHISPFNLAQQRSFHNKENFCEWRLLEAIFGERHIPNHPTKYNYKDVLRRLQNQLQEYNKTFPGIYHADATMKNIHITTQTFCTYHPVRKMMEAYLDAFHKAEQLFAKAWNSELNEDEIQDYNFIVSMLGIRDKFLSSYLHYDWLKAILPYYKTEGPCSLAYHTTSMSYRTFKPWVCSGFLQNTDLAQELVDINPGAKQMMREHAMRVSKFECKFTWSDMPEPEEDDDEKYVIQVGPKPAYEEEPVSASSTTIYVEKTAEELNGDKECAEQLMRLAGAEPLGGLRVPDYFPLVEPEELKKMLTARVKTHPKRLEDVLDE